MSESEIKNESENAEGTANAPTSPKKESAELSTSETATEAAQLTKEPSEGLDQASLLRRVDALADDEDALEKVARAEEEKLRARTAGTKKKSSKLADDANRRLQKIGEKKKADRAAGVTPKLPARERLTSSGDTFVEWVKKHQKEVALSIAGALVVGLSLVGYMSYRSGQAAKAGEVLSRGLLDARAPIVAEAEKDKRPAGAKSEKSFKTTDERRAAALAEFRAVKNQYPGSGPAFLAELSEAALLLDQRDVEGAITAYDHVRNSALGRVDVEVRGRALEGLGFAYELRAAKDPAALDEAAKVFRELELTETLGFKELGIYHQARVAEAKGDKEKAKTLLKDLRDRFTKSDARDDFRRFLMEAADDRLRALDPTAVPQRPGAGGMMGKGVGGNPQLDEAQIRRLMEQMQKQGGGGHP